MLLELEVQKLTRLGDFDIKVIDPAYVHENADPLWPDWELNMLLGLICAMFLSIGLPFFIEYWNDSFDTAHEVEELLQLPVLGTIPANFTH